MTVKIITRSPLLFLKLFFLTRCRVLNKTRKIEYYQSHTKYLHCCVFILYLVQNPSVSRSIHSESAGQVRCARVFSVVSDSLQPQGLQPAGLLCPWDSPGKNTAVHYHVLLQESNPHLLHWQLDS